MSGVAVALVLASALMHALWNVFVKAGEDRLSTMALVMATMSAGGAVLVVLAPAPALAAWPYIAASAVLNNAYFLLLIEAYRRGDLSHAYPIARGTAPLAVAVAAAVFTPETLGAVRFAGVLVVSVAIASLVWARRDAPALAPGSVAYPLATGLMIASYTVVDGLGVRSSGSPLGYIGWLFLLAGGPILALAVALRGRALVGHMRARWRGVLLAGGLSFGSYGCAILALNLGAMAPVAALRETSVIFAAAIGAKVLGEPFGRRRVLAAVGVATGVILIQAGEL